MPRFFVKTEQINRNEIIIIGEDVNHIKNVLRKKIGDKLEVCNQETGTTFECEIAEINEAQIKNHIISENKMTNSKILVDIFQGLPKAEKMELIIQKSVELGVNAIIPVKMQRCVVKLDMKSENKKIERWQKISESAAKQSGRNLIPQIHKIIKIEEISKLKNEYDIIIICYENEKENHIKKEIQKLKQNKKQEIRIAIVIGPEGGLEENEVKYLEKEGAKIVTLGNRILRTETVALNILSIIMYEFEC